MDSVAWMFVAHWVKTSLSSMDKVLTVSPSLGQGWVCGVNDTCTMDAVSNEVDGYISPTPAPYCCSDVQSHPSLWMWP